MNKEQNDYLHRFLEILGKQDCPKASENLCSVFGLNMQEQEAYELSGFKLLTHYAIDDLRAEIPQNDMEFLSDFAASESRIKKIQKLHRNLEKIISLLNDKDIQSYYKLRAQDDVERGYSQTLKICRHLEKGLNPAVTDLKLFLDSIAGPRGRPNYTNLHQFVFEIALLYQDLSGKPFTSYIHKEDQGGYSMPTEGMRFVAVAIDWLHKEALDSRNITERFSAKTIAHACEAVRKRLKNST